MRSWLAIDSDSDFSLDNIPFGIVSPLIKRGHWDDEPRAAVAIGEYILDLKKLFDYYYTKGKSGHAVSKFDHLFSCVIGYDTCKYGDVFTRSTLNDFASLGRAAHRQVREGIQVLLREDTPYPQVLKDDQLLRSTAICLRKDVEMHLPFAIGDYTDFYAGYHHAFAVGEMFRGAANAIQPNYNHLPVGYHGRASSIGVAARGSAAITRPVGQILLDPSAEVKKPTTAPSRKLDFELELGCFICVPPDQAGARVDVGTANEHIFGYVLLNDWSARDIQAWEYVPLGPFNSKNFATTISPWVVLADALEPFRAKGIPNQGPTPMQDYLKEDREESCFDIKLEVDLIAGDNTTTICRTSATNLMWSFPQMIAHHTLGGCALRSGDLLGSGTISGPNEGESGSLLELSRNGTKDVLLAGMESRTFLKDGDEVVLRGYCKSAAGVRVGFGECRGKVYPAK
ncbi:fumarylacetoacetase [Rhypophila decipiens]